MGFERTRKNGLPIWMSGPIAQGYEGALGVRNDEDLALDKGATKLHWPLEGCVSPLDGDALEQIGTNKHLLRAPGEDGSRFVGRLYRGHEAWYWAGTALGLAAIFEPYGSEDQISGEWRSLATGAYGVAELTDVQQYDNGNTLYLQRHYPPVSEYVTVFDLSNTSGAEESTGIINFLDGGNWWSRCYWHVDCANPPDSRIGPWYQDTPWDEIGEYDDGGLWDTNMTIDDVRYLLATIRRMKNYSAYPVCIAVWLADPFPMDGFWCSIGEWDDGGNWEYDEANPLPSDPLYITVGRVWEQEAGLGGWLGMAGDYPLTDVWSNEDDGLATWEAYVNPFDTSRW